MDLEMLELVSLSLIHKNVKGTNSIPRYSPMTSAEVGENYFTLKAEFCLENRICRDYTTLFTARNLLTWLSFFTCLPSQFKWKKLTLWLWEDECAKCVSVCKMILLQSSRFAEGVVEGEGVCCKYIQEGKYQSEDKSWHNHQNQCHCRYCWRCCTSLDSIDWLPVI